MSSFGAWYEEKKNEENGDAGGGNSWLPMGTDQLLPMFNTDNIMQMAQPISWEAMKSSMENQMPKKIMGMGYQQRFKVFCALLFLSALFFALAFTVGMRKFQKWQKRLHSYCLRQCHYRSLAQIVAHKHALFPFLASAFFPQP
jgi:hypothetical protein